MYNNYLDIFSDDEKLLNYKYKRISQISDSCLYILDANVLLLPYTVRSKELEIIKKVYNKLINEKKLFIPFQAVKEFVKNRPNKLSEMHHVIADYLSTINIKQIPQYKILADMEEYKEAISAYAELENSCKKYKEKVGQILEYIKKLNWDDPVSVLYSQIIDSSTVLNYKWKFEEIQKELEERHKYNIPPAFKDKTKDDKGIGDFIIWKDILEVGKGQNKDIIFVTGDEKADWFHQSGGTKLHPRYELCYEFKKYTNGRDLALINLSALIDMYSNDKEVVEAIKEVEKLNESPKLTLRELKEKAIEKANFKCEYCGIPLERDMAAIHFEPLSEDEQRNIDNVVVLCHKCNVKIENRRFSDVIVEDNNG